MQESYWDWENRCRNHTGVKRIDAGIIPGLRESMQESYRGVRIKKIDSGKIFLIRNLTPPTPFFTQSQLPILSQTPSALGWLSSKSTNPLAKNPATSLQSPPPDTNSTAMTPFPTPYHKTQPTRSVPSSKDSTQTDLQTSHPN